jgi:hypothetical protein
MLTDELLQLLQGQEPEEDEEEPEGQEPELGLEAPKEAQERVAGAST